LVALLGRRQAQRLYGMDAEGLDDRAETHARMMPRREGGRLTL
jgi:hypothetical protein